MIVNLAMVLRIVLIALFCGTFFCLHAQTKNNTVIAEAIDKGDYFYISKSAINDKVLAIHYPSTIKRNVNPAKRPIEFFWHSTCNDGSYILTITPQQIFFSSGHDNPNPNLLFWVIEISPLQFLSIQKKFKMVKPQWFKDRIAYLKKLKPAGAFIDESKTTYYDETFKDNFPIPVEWTDAIMKQHESYCDTQIKNQLKRYLAIINSCVNDPIVFPAGKMKPKYFSYSKDELKDWIPVKTIPAGKK